MSASKKFFHLVFFSLRPTESSQRNALHNVHDGAYWKGSKTGRRANAREVEYRKLHARAA
jgi:hypothetical protein